MRTGKELEARQIKDARVATATHRKSGVLGSDSTSVVIVSRRKTNLRETRPYSIKISFFKKSKSAGKCRPT